MAGPKPKPKPKQKPPQNHRQKRPYRRRNPKTTTTLTPSQTQFLTPLLSLLASATTASHSFLTQNDLHLLPSQTLTLESQITSTALSLTKLHYLTEPITSSNGVPITNSPCWFKRFIQFSSKWVEAFRMSKPTFDLLVETLTPCLRDSSLILKLSVEYIVGVGVYRLAHGGTYKAVGKRFGVNSSKCCKAFYGFCKAVNDQLGGLFELSTDLKRIVDGFNWMSLPNCCGVLGFSRFEVEGGTFGKDGAVIVQGLVDSEGRFLDVSAGWPSSMSPDDILRLTKVFARVEESKELFNGALFELENGNLIPQYILGDSCCPLLPWLLTPYDISNVYDDLNFDSSEQAFNSVHSRGMELVNKAFARVRACWKLLSVKWKEECIEFLPFVIVTGCLLINFMMKCGEVVAEETQLQFCEQDFPTYQGKGNPNGERIRDVLAWQLSLVSR
ncbi:hypothetical protein ACHQM5_028927 [Ranunculus cassubicifolius]